MTVVKSTITPAPSLCRPDGRVVHVQSRANLTAYGDWRGVRKRFDRPPGFISGFKDHDMWLSSHLSFDPGEIRYAIQGRGYLTQQTQAVYT